MISGRSRFGNSARRPSGPTAFQIGMALSTPIVSPKGGSSSSDSSGGRGVCSSHSTVLSTRRHPAHAVSALIHPREIQALWSQTYDAGSYVQPGLVGGEPVIGFSFFLFCFVFLVRCIGICSPPRRARQRCLNRSFFINSFVVVLTSCVFFLSFRIFPKVFLHLV